MSDLINADRLEVNSSKGYKLSRSLDEYRTADFIDALVNENRQMQYDIRRAFDLLVECSGSVHESNRLDERFAQLIQDQGELEIYRFKADSIGREKLDCEVFQNSFRKSTEYNHSVILHYADDWRSMHRGVIGANRLKINGIFDMIDEIYELSSRYSPSKRARLDRLSRRFDDLHDNISRVHHACGKPERCKYIIRELMRTKSELVDGIISSSEASSRYVDLKKYETIFRRKIYTLYVGNLTS